MHQVYIISICLVFFLLFDKQLNVVVYTQKKIKVYAFKSKNKM